MKDFAAEWRKARLGLGLSQKELSKILGIGQGYVSDIERGRRTPSEHLQKLLGLTIKTRSAIISPSQKHSTTFTADVSRRDEYRTMPEHLMLNTVLESGTAAQIEEVMGVISRVYGECRKRAKEESNPALDDRSETDEALESLAIGPYLRESCLKAQQRLWITSPSRKEGWFPGHQAGFFQGWSASSLISLALFQGVYLAIDRL